MDIGRKEDIRRFALPDRLCAALFYGVTVGGDTIQKLITYVREARKLPSMLRTALKNQTLLICLGNYSKAPALQSSHFHRAWYAMPQPKRGADYGFYPTWVAQCARVSLVPLSGFLKPRWIRRQGIFVCSKKISFRLSLAARKRTSKCRFVRTQSPKNGIATSRRCVIETGTAP